MSFFSARVAAGLTQAEAAQALGVSPPTVCQWEKGKTNPRSELLPAIADLYHCSIGYLLEVEPKFKE